MLSVQIQGYQFPFELIKWFRQPFGVAVSESVDVDEEGEKAEEDEDKEKEGQEEERGGEDLYIIILRREMIIMWYSIIAGISNRVQGTLCVYKTLLSVT